MAWIRHVQIRVAVTSRMIGDMKAVKMLGLTDTLFDLVCKLRRAELQASEKFRKLLVWQILTGKQALSTYWKNLLFTQRYIRKRTSAPGTFCYFRDIRHHCQSQK